MITHTTLGLLRLRIDAAQKRYGPFSSTHEALGVCCEEWAELVDAVRSNKLDHVRHEALDLAAVCIRLADWLDNETLRDRSVK